MSIRTVLTWPHEALSTPCEEIPVENIKSEEIQTLIGDMLTTVKAYRADGLAANQIGEQKKIMIVKDDQIHRVMINPQIAEVSEATHKVTEGCLSFPGAQASIRRQVTVTVSYYDEDGNPHIWDTNGIQAVAVQHELDHLNGRTMLDRLDRLSKNIVLRKLRKTKKKFTRKLAKVA